MASKEAVRLACKQRRAALPMEDCQAWADALTRQILALPEYQAAHRLMAYLAMPKEANLDGVLRQALADGKEVYVPVCLDKTTMIAVRLHDIEDVEYGVLHIRTPKKPYETIEPEELDLVLVPGAGFDHKGGRMGMGNGYYDRFLRRVRPGHFIATAWQVQLSETAIPMDATDVYMEALVTEEGCLRFTR